MKSMATRSPSCGCSRVGDLVRFGHTAAGPANWHIWGVAKCTHLVLSYHCCYCHYWILIVLSCSMFSVLISYHYISLSFIIDHYDNLIPPWTSRWWLPPMFWSMALVYTFTPTPRNDQFGSHLFIQCPDLSRAYIMQQAPYMDTDYDTVDGWQISWGFILLTGRVFSVQWVSYISNGIHQQSPIASINLIFSYIYIAGCSSWKM